MDSPLQAFLITTVGFIYASTELDRHAPGDLHLHRTESRPSKERHRPLSRAKERGQSLPRGDFRTRTAQKCLPDCHSRQAGQAKSNGQPSSFPVLIPIITIHHPEATSTFSATFAITSREAATAPPILHSEPLEMTEPASTVLRRAETHMQNPEASRQKFRFATLKANWTEKKPRLSRCISSPDLSPTLPLMPPMPLPRKSTSNDQITIPSHP
ncbi:hypothetical protein BDQ17DRAFT_1418769 [Cyathus striatus]|nr:hypothetical protein BDQ17DRAFT_1418769 [Cyathus striatus]